MYRKRFTLADLGQECTITAGCHRLDGKPSGACIQVPEDLYRQYPYNASAYTFLQELRPAIMEFGTVEFPGLPLNKCNYTLAQRAPREHLYSSNTYLTDICQYPHQDTPPYPTAFWLNAARRYFATWILSQAGLQQFMAFSHDNPAMDIEDLHKVLVPQSLQNQTGLLLNRSPGLLLIDNGTQQKLYHARTCNFDAVADTPDYDSDTPMYAFNEIGLLHYIDTLDSRRGNDNKDWQDLAMVKAFMQKEQLERTLL